jgi:hypothetical protein
MKGVIDRFEGDIVVVEIGRTTKDYPRSIFPKESMVGDIIEIDGDKVKILKKETEKRRKEIEELMNEVWDD